jgi:hypothetical protein
MIVMHALGFQIALLGRFGSALMPRPRCVLSFEEMRRTTFRKCRHRIPSTAAIGVHATAVLEDFLPFLVYCCLSYDVV